MEPIERLSRPLSATELRQRAEAAALQTAQPVLAAPAAPTALPAVALTPATPLQPSEVAPTEAAPVFLPEEDLRAAIEVSREPTPDSEFAALEAENGLRLALRLPVAELPTPPAELPRRYFMVILGSLQIDVVA